MRLLEIFLSSTFLLLNSFSQPLVEVHVVFKAASSIVSDVKSLLEQVNMGANRDTFLSDSFCGVLKHFYL